MKKIYLENAPEDLKTKIEEFFKSIQFEYELVNDQADAIMAVKFPQEREVSKKNVLFANGRIACPVAFMAAENLGISKSNLGKFLNVLDIKIFGCQLGCFK